MLIEQAVRGQKGLYFFYKTLEQVLPQLYEVTDVLYARGSACHMQLHTSTNQTLLF